MLQFKQKRGKDMKQKIIRYGFGTFLLLFLLFATLSVSISRTFGFVLLFFASIFFIIVGMKEYRSMLSNIEIYPHKVLPELTCILIALFLCISTNPTVDLFLVMPILMIGIITSFILTVIKNKKPYMLTTFYTIGGILLTFCGLYFIKLCHLTGRTFPFDILFIYIITTLLSDFTASIVGKKFAEGKPLSKEISPNKTIAGSIAHLLTSIILCSILCPLLIKYNVLFGILFGSIISIFAQLGDLTVSMIKRECGVEHSGKFFLNYGGFLDRMDAFIFSAPALFYFLMIIGFLFKGM
jgi:phosphatidate cytidylyltransferase